MEFSELRSNMKNCSKFSIIRTIFPPFVADLEKQGMFLSVMTKDKLK